jgi:hypothetical protein
MHDPLINRELLSLLKLVHGGYNLSLMLFLLYQAGLGIWIRRARKAGEPPPFASIRRHRKTGPILAGLALFGFLSGLTLVLLDTGRVLEHPVHFAVGSLLMLFGAAAVVLSRGIKGQDSRYRKPHYLVGLSFLVLYAFQILVGIEVLF